MQYHGQEILLPFLRVLTLFLQKISKFLKFG